MIRNSFSKLLAPCLNGTNKITLQKYDSPLSLASVINPFFFIDKIDNIRVEFTLLEPNLRSYSFLSMGYIMPGCSISLDNFDHVTDIELKYYF